MLSAYRFRAGAQILLLVFTIASHAGVYVQGKVRTSAGVPVASADVSLLNLVTTTTSENGEFVLDDPAVGNLNLPSSRIGFPVKFRGSRIIIPRPEGQRILAELFDPRGRRMVLLSPRDVSQGPLVLTMNSHRLASGIYFVRVHIGSTTIATKLTVRSSDFHWHTAPLTYQSINSPSVASSNVSDFLVNVSADGYSSRSVPLLSDTVFGMDITLYQQGIDLPAEVSVIESTETAMFRLPGYDNNRVTKWNKLWWAEGSIIRSYLDDRGFSDNPVVEKSFKVIHLDNGVVRVTVSPDLGMRVLRVLDISREPHCQMFAQWTSPVNETPFAQNIGGVKPSFPYHENSTGMIDDNGDFNCRAGYFVERTGDGTARIVMNLRFDYHQSERDAGFTGKYGDTPLTGIVSLSPGHSDFLMKYVAENPNPLRRPNRIWTDALYPQDSLNFLNGSWIFPTRYALQHCAEEYFDIQRDGVTGSRTASYFALFPQYGFAGFYKPDDGINRLRVTDPHKYPACKIYDKTPFELWGGTNVLFESPQDFVRAFEPNVLEHRYYLARGIGKAVFANEYIAIGTEDSSFFLTAPAPLKVDIYEYGTQSDPIATDIVIGPTQPVATGIFKNGLRVVVDQKEVCNVRIPLVYTDNLYLWNTVRARAELSGCGGLTTFDSRYGYQYELENIPTKPDGLSSLTALRAARNVTDSDNPEVIASIANACYRNGAFDLVDSLLAKLGNRAPSHASYLRALMNLEKDTMADFSGSVIEGNYFLALQSIKDGHTDSAITYLNDLLQQRPDALSPRLLRAYLRNDLSDALRAYERAPGSIEVWTTLAELGYPGAAQRLETLLRQNQSATDRKEAFLAELQQGQWKHERRFEYVSSWFEKIDIPPFPSELKYK